MGIRPAGECQTSLDLLDRILIQNGTHEDPDLEESDIRWANRKIIWTNGSGHFGDRVEVHWANGRVDYGYLTTLPGHHEADMDGVIHIPDVAGEKASCGPMWITLLDCALAARVEKILITKD